MKSISLVLGANRATLSGPRSKQHRIRQNAKAFAGRLRAAGFGVRKWTNISNKHFAAVAAKMKEQGVGDGRIAEVFSAARHLCEAYGNTRISPTNDVFGVKRGTIANVNSKAVAPEFVLGAIAKLETELSYEHGPRCAAQIRLQYELGLRREESAKVDLVADWDREGRSLLIQHGPKGGRPRTLHNLSDRQQEALERALPYVSQSNRPGIHNLMPIGMGDKWQEKLSYAARLCGFTKKESGWMLHGNRHERFHHMYVEHTGFQPPNQHDSVAAFQKAAWDTTGDEWPRLDAEARDDIEVTAGHSPGRRDVSDAYLGCSRQKKPRHFRRGFLLGVRLPGDESLERFISRQPSSPPVGLWPMGGEDFRPLMGDSSKKVKIPYLDSLRSKVPV